MMALHEQCVGATDEWYTPPHVFEALGCSFDMDVAAPFNRKHVCVPTNHWILQDSLSQHWRGFVWMNPPFGGRNGLIPWLEKFFEHSNGIALVPDRTSAPWWQQFAPRADLTLFVAPKLKFISPNGKPGDSPAQGTCLFASGWRAINALYRARERGLGVLMCTAGVQTGVSCGRIKKA
jgi:hypothetical protein